MYKRQAEEIALHCAPLSLAESKAILWSDLRTASAVAEACLLYTSDAADELPRVDPGGRRILKKKNNHNQCILGVEVT